MVYIKPPTNAHGVSRVFGNGHNGIDYMFPMNTPVYAAADGVIDFEGDGKFHSWLLWYAGICVLIKHSDMYTGYAHLSSTIVNKGQTVKKGDLIGYSGSTGNSTGPHLHFEVIDMPQNWQNGYAARINPAPFFEPSIKTATVDQVKQAYLDILERPADSGAITHYTKYSNDFVRQDLLNSQEYRDLQARKAAQAIADADTKRKEAAAKAEAERIAAENNAKIEAEKKAAEEAAAKNAAIVASQAEFGAIIKENNTLLKQILALIKQIFRI